jgi:hypothetical protein
MILILSSGYSFEQLEPKSTVASYAFSLREFEVCTFFREKDVT